MIPAAQHIYLVTAQRAPVQEPGPRITGSLRVDGNYLDARQVGSIVRLVVRSAPRVSFPPSSTIAANQRLIRAQPLSAWLPRYVISGGTRSTARTVPCGQVSHPEAYTGSSLLTVYTLDLGRLGANALPVTVAADGDTVYADTESLYLAGNPDWFCCIGAAGPAPAAQRTQLHQFDIRGSNRPTYRGSASIPGRLLSQYSLSEYAGSLRIATTEGTVQGFATNSSGQSNSLYVLNVASLRVTAHLNGLGRNEQIYAVRFEGPMAYLVTFRQTDPLFLIDLHDPAAPKVVGSLHLTGYSDYLHDLGQGRLLGVGQEASAAGKVAGLQVSLFDIRTPARPLRTGHVVRPDAVGESTLDPHSFLYWPATGLVVVPLQSWTAPSGQVLVLTVTGTSLRTVGLLANPRPPSRQDYDLGIQRSLVVDGNLWTVSRAGVQVSDPARLHRLAWVSFG